MRTTTLMTIGLMALAITAVYAGSLNQDQTMGAKSIAATASVPNGVIALGSVSPFMIIKAKGKKNFNGHRWRRHWGHRWGHGFYDPWFGNDYDDYNNGYTQSCYWNGYETVCQITPNDPYWN